MMYEITSIKAVAECAGEKEVQEALLIHEIKDEFCNGDCILFGYSEDELTTDEEIKIALTNNTPVSDWTYENGIFYAH